MDEKKANAATQQWRQHTADEAQASAAQQEDARPGHGPVTGPPPYGSEKLNVFAADIIRSERERCARLVETWPADAQPDAAALLAEVARAIRAQA